MPQETFEKSFIKKVAINIIYMPQETFEKSFIKKVAIKCHNKGA